MTKKSWSLTTLVLIVVGLVIAAVGASVAQAVYVGGAHNGVLDGTDYNDDGYTQTVETVTPVGACPGETVTVTGTATPGETVTVVIALERVTNWGGGTVPAGDDRYEITLGTAQAGVSGGWSLSAALPTTVVRNSDYMQVDTPAGDWRITVIGLDGYMSDGFVTILDCGQTTPPPVARNYYWTWYDNVYMRNWVLMANPAGATSTLNFGLEIAGSDQDLAPFSFAGFATGEVPAGKALTPKIDNLMGGPVKVTSNTGESAIVSQRSLMGNSLEEVLGTDEGRLSDHFWWTWYDQQSAGYANWVLVANPSDSETVRAEIRIQGNLMQNKLDPSSPDYNQYYFDIEPGKNVTPTFPGVMGGPVEVKAHLAGGSWPTDARPVIASQRVLSNNGSAFNEVPGIPDEELSDSYQWTWYDGASFRDWILVANPNSTDVSFQVKIGGTLMPCHGTAPGTLDTTSTSCTLAPGAKETPMYPGTMNGPVEVIATGGNVIVSQRVVAGPSFEEIPGYPVSALASDYHWSWYDGQSVGARNWILVANPTSGSVTYQVKIAGDLMPCHGTAPGTADIISTSCTLAAGAKETPEYPGTMNGPVEVIASGNVMVSQRVTWNGYFNEVLGTVLS